MTADPAALAIQDLALAALLVLVNAGLSLWQALGLERRLLLAAVRMVAQLFLVGLILKMLFSLASPAATVLTALIMAGFATHEIRARQENRLRGWWGYGLGGGAMILSGFLVTGFALTALLRPDPWYHPRFALPLLGMILGNTMTGVSLGLNTFTATLKRETAAIEAQLMLGADRWQALQPVIRHALSTAFMPTINAMAATGVVFLPGMMTGQILAGADPQQAVRYQLLILFLINGTTGLGTLLAVFATANRLTDGRHRLRFDRLAPGRSGKQD